MALSTKDEEFIDQLIALIESQLGNPGLDVNYICKAMGMSRTKFYQIGDFIRTVRLRKAMQIMTEEDVLITEVVYRVGMQTQSCFTKAFKKKFGKTPTQFLQELEK